MKNIAFDQEITPMTYHTKTRTLCAIWLATVLLGGSGGCSMPHGVRWNPLLVPGRHHRPPVAYVPVPDPVPYGYYETCWHPWPGQCVGCPTGAIEVEAAGGAAGRDAVDSPVQRLPAVSQPKDWEVLPVPDATPPADEDQATPPTQDDHPDGKPLRFRDEELPAEGDDLELLPEPEDTGPPKDERLPVEPPQQGDSSGKVARREASRPAESRSQRNEPVQPATFLEWYPSLQGDNAPFDPTRDAASPSSRTVPESAPATQDQGPPRSNSQLAAPDVQSRGIVRARASVAGFACAATRESHVAKKTGRVSHVDRKDGDVLEKVDQPKKPAGRKPKARKRKHFLSK